MSRLDEIKARLAAASPGPWRALTGLRQNEPRFGGCAVVPMLLANNEHALGDLSAHFIDADRALIMNAREDVEYLLAELAGAGCHHGETPTRVVEENRRLVDKLEAFTQTAWEAQAQVDKLLKEVKDLRDVNDRLARENARLTALAWEAQKRHPSEESFQALRDQIKTREAVCEKLEADNKALRVSGTELKALYDERLERYKDLADGVADQLEKLGFRVLAPGHDVCDND